MLLRRSRADSNRCGSFCRALPSHSATGPFLCRRICSNKTTNLFDAVSFRQQRCENKAIKGILKF